MSEDMTAQIAQVAIVRPGDTLVVSLSPNTFHRTAIEVSAMLREKLPGIEVLMIAAEEAVEMVVYRPGELPASNGGSFTEADMQRRTGRQSAQARRLA